ncbi:hypothetical protein JCM8547_004302 [Rhodosporidiobolus lusitaniae]
MTQDLAYSFNPNVQGSAAPPIPLAGLWASKYFPTADAPLLNLAQGVPGDLPPQELLNRLAEAARDPKTTGYGDLRGDVELRRELARDVNEAYGIPEGQADGGESRLVTENDVVLTAGCNLAFYATVLALACPGDEMILPTPWYFNHEMTLTQLGITLVPLRCSPPSFLPSPSECASLIRRGKTKAIVLVTPNNPTGAVYPEELLREFAELAEREGVPLVLDETYREFVKGRPHGLFADGAQWRKYLIHLFSFSKSYAIPGHRLGALLASPLLLSQISKLLDCLQICPARPAQQALVWAVEGIREWRERVRDELGERQRVFRELMGEVEGWQVETGSGYFAYVKHPFPSFPSQLVAARLGEHVGVVVLPGTFFSPPFEDVGEDRYIRFSIANVSLSTLSLVPARLRHLNDLWPTLPSQTPALT